MPMTLTIAMEWYIYLEAFTDGVSDVGSHWGHVLKHPEQVLAPGPGHRLQVLQDPPKLKHKVSCPLWKIYIITWPVFFCMFCHVSSCSKKGGRGYKYMYIENISWCNSPSLKPLLAGLTIERSLHGDPPINRSILPSLSSYKQTKVISRKSFLP